MACLAIWIGTATESGWQTTLPAAIACALLWPFVTALGVCLLLSMAILAAVVSLGISASLLPANFVLALRGKEPIKPYPPPSNKQPDKGTA
jgi:hypothetical protein